MDAFEAGKQFGALDPDAQDKWLKQFDAGKREAENTTGLPTPEQFNAIVRGEVTPPPPTP